MNRRELLAEVKNARRRAINKRSRLNVRGIVIRDTKYDPIRSLDKVNKYNTRQLRSYLNQLNNFNSRTVAFVPGRQGAPIPKKKWLEYQKAEKQVFEKVRKHEQQFDNVKLPGSKMTVGEARKFRRPDRPFSANPATNARARFKRKSTMVTGDEQLDKLVRDMRKKVKGDFIGKDIERARKDFNKMIDYVGDDSLKKLANSLTNTQFDFLWSEGDLAHNVSLLYEQLKYMANEDRNDPSDFDIVSETGSEIRDMIEYVKHNVS